MNASSTSKKVGCDDDFCSFISQSDSCQPALGCSYHIVYADESTSDGKFIRDMLTLEQVTGDLKTGPLGQEVVFGWALISSLSFRLWFVMYFFS